MQDTDQEIPLTAIELNPWNPRGKIEGPKFEELKDSIREKGVLQPILVRPLSAKGKFGLIFGERRLKAKIEIATENGGPEGFTIPAKVRELTDDQAFDLMMIENLQREDLTDLEEARGFKAYIDRNGAEALPALAKRIGKEPAHIRRKIAVVQLPKKILTAYVNGEIQWGHCEQLARLRNKKKIMELYNSFNMPFNMPFNNISVAGLRERINDMLPLLQHARFDTKKTKCDTCESNTAVQTALFGEDIINCARPACTDPTCFKKHQNNWFLTNWQKTGFYRSFATTGFRFQEDISWNEYEYFTKKPSAKCKECPYFVSLLTVEGKIETQQACIGDKDCFHNEEREKTRTPGSSKDNGMAQGKPWHGEHFREQFFKQHIPERLENYTYTDEKILKLTLISILYSNNEIHEWFLKTYADRKDDDDLRYWSRPLSETWNVVQDMETAVIEKIIKEATVMISNQYGFGSDMRMVIGTWIGLDLKKDWVITEEYLDKKTIKEIHALAEKFGIYEDEAAKKFLYEVLLKKRGKFTNCKKDELKRVFLESGVDLAGKVPDEIMNTDPDR